MEKREIAKTGVEITPIIFGSTGIGSMPEALGYEVEKERGVATVQAIFEGPVNCIDTSNNYSDGEAERRIGEVIKSQGLPDGFVINTKLDRDKARGGFDAARARKSLEESLERLGIDRVPLLHFHDPEHCANLDEITRKGGSIDELFKMKEEGLCDAVGLAMGNIDLQFALIKDFPFDALINHNRFNLINRSASAMYDYAHEKGMAIINAAPFVSGVLAKGSAVMPRITYQEASEEELQPIKRIEAVCAKHGIAPGAAALQFSVRDPRITATLVGVSKPERVQQTLDWANAEISQEAWDELMALDYSMEDPEAGRVV